MEWILILILIIIGWFWIDSLDKRERAIALGTELAGRFNLQMLDEPSCAVASGWVEIAKVTCNCCALMRLM